MADLDQKTVHFKISVEGIGPIQGTGKFLAISRGDGKLKVKIESRERQASPTDGRYFYVPQESVSWIKRHPSEPDQFLLEDPALQT